MVITDGVVCYLQPIACGCEQLIPSAALCRITPAAQQAPVMATSTNREALKKKLKEVIAAQKPSATEAAPRDGGEAATGPVPAAAHSQAFVNIYGDNVRAPLACAVHSWHTLCTACFSNTVSSFGFAGESFN